jgi:hypothetical protein
VSLDLKEKKESEDDDMSAMEPVPQGGRDSAGAKSQI